MNSHHNTVPGRPAFRIGTKLFELSAVWRPWQLSATFILAIVALLLVPLSITLGDYPISFGRVLEVISSGQGTRLEKLVVFEWRMPRALTALTVGCALGLAGALTQSVTRNPLASPDILGITAGASAMAVTVIVFGSGTGIIGWLAGIGVPLAAFIGAVSTSIVVWVLSWKGDANPFRLLLSGIIITSLLSGYISFAMIRAQLHDASVAQFWLTGSLDRANWTTTFPVTIALIISAPTLGWVSYQLLPTALGQDLAKALGSRFNAVQFSVLMLAVALTAVAVSAAGPIGFVAFVAPQIALRVCRTATPPLLASAFTGAILLLGADVAIHALLGVELPVGIVTSIIGGLFLLYLLVQQNRKVQSA